VSYADLVNAYKAEQPLYDRVIAVAAPKLEAELKSAAISATVKGRSKEPDSFATKAMLKGYERPLEQIADKAGIRVVAIYERDLKTIEGMVRRLFHVISAESKLDALAYNEFGYLGIHCDCTLLPEDTAGQNADLAGRRLEIQIRTIVESAWAEVSHEQLYKPAAEVPDDLKRQIHRLVALVELFDAEVERFREAATATPGYREADVLVPLKQVLLERFGQARAWSGQLSRIMAAALVPLYQVDVDEVYANVLASWIDANEDALSVQFTEAEALPSNPLFFQPEIFLILERLDNDRARLRNTWPNEVPAAWLEELAAAWGAGA
jgi:ppGpp synthetase/RelA/SpoT-type nucleotidyltranferase